MVNIKKKYENVNTLSRQQYNVALGSLLVSGLLLNFFMCQISFGFSNSFAFIIGYLIATFATIFIAHVSDNKIVLTLCYYVIVIPLGVVLSETQYSLLHLYLPLCLSQDAFGKKCFLGLDVFFLYLCCPLLL